MLFEQKHVKPVAHYRSFLPREEKGEILSDLIPPVFRGPDNPVRRKKHHEHDHRKKSSGDATDDGSIHIEQNSGAKSEPGACVGIASANAPVSTPQFSDTPHQNIAFLLLRDEVCASADHAALDSAHLNYATEQYKSQNPPLTQAPPLQISQNTKPR